MNDGVIYNGEIIADGKLHRFNINGDTKSSKNGWYVLYADNVPSGAYGCWKRGISESWCSKSKDEMTTEQLSEFRLRINAAKSKAIQIKTTEQGKAKLKAKRIWDHAKSANNNHPYLQHKGVTSHGLRVNDFNQLIIPLFDIYGELQSLQFISPSGKKRFLPNGKVSANHFLIDKIQNKTSKLYIGEGHATCATIHAAIGFPVVSAFNSSNLLNVAKIFRERYPNIEIIMVADNDSHLKDNPGLTQAKEAAEAVNGQLVYPNFSGFDQSGKPSDFNDLMLLSNLDEVRKQLKNHQSIIFDDALIVRLMSDVKSKPIKWLWPHYIALGKLIMIAGNPGLGKSQLTANIAAIVTTGGKWPITEAPCPKGMVAFLSAEDDVEDTIKPRLVAAGADVSRIFTIEAVPEREQKTNIATRRHFNLKTDIEKLGKLLTNNPDISVVFIDPITAYLGNTDSHKNSDVRALLAPLMDLAAKHEVSIIAVSHLNKSASTEALMRVSGSLGFVAAARAAFLVARDPTDDNKRLFLPMKNNIGKDQTGFAFRIEECKLPDNIETSKIVWSDECVDTKADEILSQQNNGNNKLAIEEAEDFLTIELANTSKDANSLFSLAKQNGIAEKTLQRAKNNLGIRIHREGFGKGSKSIWSLPLKEEAES